MYPRGTMEGTFAGLPIMRRTLASESLEALVPQYNSHRYLGLEAPRLGSEISVIRRSQLEPVFRSLDDDILDRGPVFRRVNNLGSAHDRLGFPQSKLSQDWSSFDHKKDPYYLEKREQVLNKVSFQPSLDCVVNENLSYEARLRAISDQLQKLKQSENDVKNILVASRTDHILVSTAPMSERIQPKLDFKQSKSKKDKKSSVANIASRSNSKGSSEDPYDKYNKNPIGNIVGKRAQRIKQKLAEKNAGGDEKQDENEGDDEIVVLDQDDSVPDSSTEVGESSQQFESQEGTSRFKSNSESELSNSQMQPDSSTDALIPSTQSNCDSDNVDSTTPAIQFLTQRQNQQGTQPNPVSKEEKEPDDDGMLAMFLREQRKSVHNDSKSVSTQPTTKIPFSLKRIPPTTAPSVPKVSALRRFHQDQVPRVRTDESTMSIEVVSTRSFSRVPESSAYSRTTLPQFESEDSFSWSAPKSFSNDDDEDVKSRLLREEMQAMEEARLRETLPPPSPADIMQPINPWATITRNELALPMVSRTGGLASALSTLRPGEQRKLAIEYQREHKRIEKLERERMEVLKRLEIEKRIQEEQEVEREKTRQMLLAEQKRLFEEKRKFEDERRKREEEEKRERERVEREAKERERREKLRRQKADLSLRQDLIEALNVDMNEEFCGSMDADIKAVKTERFTESKLTWCFCFENPDSYAPIERLNIMNRMHIFQEDINFSELAGNFDDELMIGDIDTACDVAKENIKWKRMEKFEAVLKKVPENFPENPDACEKLVDEEWRIFHECREDDESFCSDSELLEIVESLKEDCRKMREKLQNAAENAAKLKDIRSQISSEETSKIALRNHMVDVGKREASQVFVPRSTNSTSSIATVVRRNPDDPGRINYEPGKRNQTKQTLSSELSRSAHSNQLFEFIKEAEIEAKRERNTSPLGFPVPPPNIFPNIPPPSDPALYDAAAASFAANYFPNLSSNHSSSPSADTISKIGGVTIIKVPEREGNRSASRSPPARRRPHKKRRGRSRSRSLSSSDFRLPPKSSNYSSKRRNNSPPSVTNPDSEFSSRESRSPVASTSKGSHRKHKKVKSKKHRKEKESKKSKLKSKKESKSKRKHSEKNLKRRIKEEPLDDEDCNPSSKIFINPHHENFRRYYSVKEQTITVTKARAISISSDSSSD